MCPLRWHCCYDTTKSASRRATHSGSRRLIFSSTPRRGLFGSGGEIRNMQSTTILTMGTALNRAHDHDAIVEVLVGGQWLTGVVAGVDGYGVVLVDAQNDHSVVRMEAISAVRVPGRLAEHQIEARDLYDASVC
jgi:sRNA-binding regulator protein Hfq